MRIRSARFARDRSPTLHGSTWMTFPACSIWTLAWTSGVISMSPPVAGNLSAAVARRAGESAASTAMNQSRAPTCDVPSRVVVQRIASSPFPRMDIERLTPVILPPRNADGAKGHDFSVFSHGAARRATNRRGHRAARRILRRMRAPGPARIGPVFPEQESQMRNRFVAVMSILGALVAVVWLAAVPLSGQASSSRTNGGGDTKTYVVKKTPWGDPDRQGT